MEDRQDRANYIIMFNVPESSTGSRVQEQGDDANGPVYSPEDRVYASSLARTMPS